MQRALVFREKLRITGLADFFAAVVVSGELGFAKPDTRAFAAAADAVGVRLEEVVNGRRSRGAGRLWGATGGDRHGGVVDRGSDPPPADLHGALRIAHLGELAALLEKIRPDT